MASRTIAITDELHEYIVRETVDEHEVLARLREETAALPNAIMQLSPEQGQFMAWLLGSIAARRVIEVGTFTGYSSARMALAIGPEGRVVTCDVNEESTDVARRYWREAGVDARIDLRLGPAVDTLDALLAEGESASFDFAFIDADKKSYPRYYEQCLELVRTGGVIGVDNALWSGRVADPEESDDDTEALRAVTRLIFADERVSASLVPVGDGLILARKL